MVNIRDSLADALPAPRRRRPGRMGDRRGAGRLRGGRRRDGGARRGHRGRARRAERVWLVEHPPLYTAGTSARDEDLVEPDRFPVFRSGRGGQFTYHGPGQRVAYVMLDLNRRTPDLRRYVAALEAWLIATLAAFNVRGERREDRVGVWVRTARQGARPPRTRSPRSASASAAG